MNAWSFLAALVDALAGVASALVWPAAIVAVVLILRVPLRAMLGAVETLEIGAKGVKATLRRLVEEVGQTRVDAEQRATQLAAELALVRRDLALVQRVSTSMAGTMNPDQAGAY